MIAFGMRGPLSMSLARNRTVLYVMTDEVIAKSRT